MKFGLCPWWKKKGRSDEEIEELEGNGVVGCLLRPWRRPEELEGNGVVGCLLLPMAAPGKLEGDHRRGVGFEGL